MLIKSKFILFQGNSDNFTWKQEKNIKKIIIIFLLSLLFLYFNQDFSLQSCAGKVDEFIAEGGQIV